MLTAFTTTFLEMLKIFVLLLLGYIGNKTHIIPKGAGTGISRLVTKFFLPALLLHNNMTEFDPTQVISYAQLVLTGAAIWFAVTLLMRPVAKALAGNEPLDRGVYMYGLSLSNTGAVGMPLALAMMGSYGLHLFTLFLLVNSIATYAWGVNLFLDMPRKNNLKRFFVNLLNPVFVAMLIGLTLGACGSREWMPKQVTDVTKMLSDCFVPVSLLLTGYTIADYPLGRVFGNVRAWIFTAIRLVAIPALVLVACFVLGLSQQVATLALLAHAGPSGMNVVLFPASYGRDCHTGVSTVLLSSLSAIFTVPVFYALVQMLFS